MALLVVQFLGLVLGFTMSLNLLGIIYKPFQFYGRFLLCFLSMCTCATYGLFASVVLSLIGKKSLSQWAAGRAFSTLTCPLIGLDIKIQNEEILTKTRPAIFISNHQTELDILLLGRLFPRHCSVTAKSSLKYVPFLGWFMMASGTVFIDRQNRGKAIRALDGAINSMQKNQQSVFIFPEGTRSYFDKPELLSFKRGAFHLALQSGFPIVPVVIANYSHVFSLRNRLFRPGTITVRVLDPIDVTGFDADNIDQLIETTRANMLATLKQISSKKEQHDQQDGDEHTQLLSSIESSPSSLLSPSSTSLSTSTTTTSSSSPSSAAPGTHDVVDADANPSELEPRVSAASALSGEPIRTSSSKKQTQHGDHDHDSKLIELDNRA
ncbi:hypothetical protein V1514DRAFT_307684 [Lipomyces japonicus]|uniref:uncharacterized protein n=1 Tax=Lipomyces japonicus TaxID=56871 RepID=UPI0034CF3BAB